MLLREARPIPAPLRSIIWAEPRSGGVEIYATTPDDRIVLDGLLLLPGDQEARHALYAFLSLRSVSFGPTALPILVSRHLEDARRLLTALAPESMPLLSPHHVDFERLEDLFAVGITMQHILDSSNL